MKTLKTACRPSLSLRTFAEHMVTGKDGESIDPARVLWILITLLYIAGCVYQTVMTRAFDAAVFAINAAVILGAGGAAVGLKAHTEPEPAPEPEPKPEPK